jgi:hypothetical protein
MQGYRSNFMETAAVNITCVMVHFIEHDITW